MCVRVCVCVCVRTVYTSGSGLQLVTLNEGSAADKRETGSECVRVDRSEFATRYDTIDAMWSKLLPRRPRMNSLSAIEQSCCIRMLHLKNQIKNKTKTEVFSQVCHLLWSLIVRVFRHRQWMNCWVMIRLQ